MTIIHWLIQITMNFRVTICDNIDNIISTVIWRSVQETVAWLLWKSFWWAILQSSHHTHAASSKRALKCLGCNQTATVLLLQCSFCTFFLYHVKGIFWNCNLFLPNGYSEDLQPCFKSWRSLNIEKEINNCLCALFLWPWTTKHSQRTPQSHAATQKNSQGLKQWHSEFYFVVVQTAAHYYINNNTDSMFKLKSEHLLLQYFCVYFKWKCCKGASLSISLTMDTVEQTQKTSSCKKYFWVLETSV